MFAMVPSLYYITHVGELCAIIQWKIFHDPPYKRDSTKDNRNTKKCFHYLSKTSRSFVAVIEQLHPELLMPVCLCYLILRGLDTIEDDTSISAKEKEPYLRSFQEFLEVDGWSFTKNRPEEKDRDLLVNFDCVVQEFKKLRQEYKDIIMDVTNKMGNGMADYCLNATFNENGVDTVKDYDLYCYYVAGLLGEGSTRMFVEGRLGDASLLNQPQLMVSMGLFLQKTNIIRDVREDFNDNRRFCPREIWSKHVKNFADLFDPQHEEAALNCSSEMILNALNHTVECLSYLAILSEQSVFNFCAIPQSMAIATLTLCFRNPQMFKRTIKITKGEACQCMLSSTRDFESLCKSFQKYTQIIRMKNVPQDPSFLEIHAVCDKIDQFIDLLFSSARSEANCTTEKLQLKQISGDMLVEPLASAKKAVERRGAGGGGTILIGKALLALSLSMVTMVNKMHPSVF